MTRQIICALLRLTLRIFFRRIEIAGLERVPRRSPAIFVLNHPNGLVDPVFILCLAPRRVSFLAKAPLFRMPVVGFLVRALDSLPVYRRQDECEDTSRNRETFELARALLARNGTIAICPEGVSHNEPRLRPLKTGAARIALGATSLGEKHDLKIVPAGLYYTSKTTFRSSALLYFGEPIAVEPVAIGPDGERSQEAVRALSDRIERALREVMLNAEQEEALATIARAEKIFSSVEQNTGGGPSLARELELRRRFVEGYAFHRTHSPERLAALEARITRFEEELKQARLDPHELSAPTSSTLTVVTYLATRVLLFACLSPPALVGLLVHYPAYRLAGYFAKRFADKQDDVVSTIKILAAMLLFPLTWAIVSVLLFAFAGWKPALLALLLAPVAGYTAVRVSEEFDRFVGGVRAFAFFFTRSRFFKQLLVERRAIHNEILALGNKAERNATDHNQFIISAPPQT